MPMLIIDAQSTIKDRATLSARAAGIIGFSPFGKDISYSLRDDLSLDISGIRSFLDKHSQQTILLFGFTSIVFQHLIKPLEAMNDQIDLSNCVLIHGGGWKKLADQKIDNSTFKSLLRSVCGITHVHNYYGMVEQTGSIFMECGHGHMHCSNFSDIIIRDAQFRSLPYGERGLIELISLLPHSYPGHIILSEDVGAILGEDTCPCGRKGKYFHVYGRTENAELRGCSDVR
jgi:hypothetical protein